MSKKDDKAERELNATYQRGISQGLHLAALDLMERAKIRFGNGSTREAEELRTISVMLEAKAKNAWVEPA